MDARFSEEDRKRLADPVWRLSNLYAVKDAQKGKVVPFRPRPEQLDLFRAVHERGLRRIVVLKARRLGMSTAIDVLAVDLAIFNSGVQISVIDQTQDDASKKLNGICKVAFAGLNPALRSLLTVTRDNDSSWEVSMPGDASASAIYAGKNARGGTNQLLHVSEWGPIQADDPRRSEEILTGALPSAEHGIVIVETTWKGGKGGHLWTSIVEPAMQPGDKGERDWHLFFFPWWIDQTYSEPGNVGDIEAESAKYLSELEQEIQRKLSDGQKVWYARRRRELGMFIWREFPSTIDECFRAPMEGAIYADMLDKLRARGCIAPADVDGSALVHTFWDLGSPLNTVTWYVQMTGSEIRVIDVDISTEKQPLDLTVTQRVSRILGKGYLLGWHYLPHDAAATERSGRTFQAELSAAGLKNTRIVPRTADVWVGINRLRQLMPRMRFRIPACDAGLSCLENYHTRRETTGGLAVDIPVHDWSSHAADALRMFAEAEMAGMIEVGSATAVQSRRGHPRARVTMGFRGDDVRVPARARMP